MANNVIFNVIANTSQYSKGMKTVVSETSKTTKIMNRAFLGLTATITTSLISFANYETELKKVGKTADLQGKELEDMGKEITKMSERIPISTKKLLELTSASAQIGVKGKKNLVEFTETVAKLTTATNIAGAQGASSIARFLKVVDGGTKNIKLFANIITELGNNTAATEAEILNMATRVGQATTQFNLGITNTLGLSAALKDLGFRSEEAGTATGKVFRSLQKAVNEGGVALETLSRITGMTGEQFKEVFEKDATQALEIFIEALSKLPSDQVAKSLENLELKGDRVNKLLVVLASNNDILTNSLELSREEAEKQKALNEEFSRALETLTNDFIRAKNEIVNLAISIGKDLAPEVKSILKSLTSTIREIRKFNEATGGSISKSIALAFKLLLAVKAIKKFEVILKKTKLGTDLMNASVKKLNLSLGSTIFLLIGAVKAGQKLGELIGKLGAVKTSEEELRKERQKLIKLANKRFELQEKLQSASEERRAGLEEELGLVDGEIERKKALIGLLEQEVEARAGLKEQKDQEKEDKEEQEEVDIEESPERLRLLSDKELRENIANEEIARKNQERQQFLKSEEKFGKSYAKLEKFYNNERLQGARQAANELVALQNSENKTLASIGKAAAIFQITNDTARGAMSAYASLAPIPYIGPALGIAAAGAVIAYGAERVANVKGNSFAVGTDFVPSDMLANIHQGEGIIPAKQNRFLQSGETALMSSDLLQNLTNQDNGNNSQTGQAGNTIIEINFEGATINGNFDEEVSLDIANNIAKAIDERRFTGFPTNIN